MYTYRRVAVNEENPFCLICKTYKCQENWMRGSHNPSVLLTDLYGILVGKNDSVKQLRNESYTNLDAKHGHTIIKICDFQIC